VSKHFFYLGSGLHGHAAILYCYVLSYYLPRTKPDSSGLYRVSCLNHLLVTKEPQAEYNRSGQTLETYNMVMDPSGRSLPRQTD